jgi:hypothetical protein
VPRKTNKVREGCVKTRKELAAALGVASPTIYHWRDMPIEPDGFYDVEKIRLWWSERTITRKRPDLPSVGEIDATLKALAVAKAQVADLCKTSTEVADIFRSGRLNILSAQQAKMTALARTVLDTFDEKTVKDLKVQDRIRLLYTLTWCFGVTFDKERLEAGESTENVGVIVKYIKEIQEKRRQGRGSVPATPSSGAELPAGGEPWADY